MTCWPTLTETKIFLKVGKSLKQGSLQTHRKFGSGPSPQLCTKLTLWYLTRVKIERKKGIPISVGLLVKQRTAYWGKELLEKYSGNYLTVFSFIKLQTHGTLV